MKFEFTHIHTQFILSVDGQGSGYTRKGGERERESVSPEYGLLRRSPVLNFSLIYVF